MERYLLITSRYVWAESDVAAVASAEADAKLEGLRYDNACKVVSLDRAPFGSVELKKVI